MAIMGQALKNLFFTEPRNIQSIGKMNNVRVRAILTLYTDSIYILEMPSSFDGGSQSEA